MQKTFFRVLLIGFLLLPFSGCCTLFPSLCAPPPQHVFTAGQQLDTLRTTSEALVQQIKALPNQATNPDIQAAEGAYTSAQAAINSWLHVLEAKIDLGNTDTTETANDFYSTNLNDAVDKITTFQTAAKKALNPTLGAPVTAKVTKSLSVGTEAAKFFIEFGKAIFQEWKNDQQADKSVLKSYATKLEWKSWSDVGK